jgi:hypothetical protein
LLSTHYVRLHLSRSPSAHASSVWSACRVSACASAHRSLSDMRPCECMCALSMCVPGMSMMKLNTPPRDRFCFAPDVLQNGHKDATLSRCTILSRLDMEHTEAIHRTRRSVHSDGPTGNYYDTSQARARPRLPTAWALPGVSQLYTVNGDFSRKMTYSPDEPRGWTPRLMIYDNELAYS